MTTRALFVNASANTIYDSHSIYYLAAYLKRCGVTVGYVQNRHHGRLLEEVADFAPDLVLYSAFSADLDAYIGFDRLVKERLHLKSIIGGPGPTFDQGFLESSTIDALCVGEGEYALEQYIASGFKSGDNIMLREEPGKVRLGRLVADLDALPFPDRESVYAKDALLRNARYRMFLSGRGCPYNCTYCYNNLYNQLFKDHGRILRQKSVGYLIEEMVECRKKHPYEVAIFQDDTFIHDKAWLREFCERLPREVGTGFLCNVRANLIDEEAVQLLKAGGCLGVNWSIESGSEAIRRDVLKRRMSEAQILQAAELLNKHGIRHRIGNLLGIPGETWEQALSTLELNLKAKPFLAIGSIFIPFKGLELTQYAMNQGFLRQDYLANLPKTFLSQTALEFPEPLKRSFQKLAFLFPLFTMFPFLYRRPSLRKMAFFLPRWVDRILGTVVYGLRMAQLYRVSRTPVMALRLFAREVLGR